MGLIPRFTDAHLLSNSNTYCELTLQMSASTAFQHTTKRHGNIFFPSLSPDITVTPDISTPPVQKVRGLNHRSR